MLHGSLTMPINWSVGHRCLGCCCPVPTSRPSVPHSHCCLGSDYLRRLNCRVQAFRGFASVWGLDDCLASSVCGGFISLEKSKPQPLNVTNSTNKPALKVFLCVGRGALAGRYEQTQSPFILTSEAGTFAQSSPGTSFLLLPQ